MIKRPRTRAGLVTGMVAGITVVVIAAAAPAAPVAAAPVAFPPGPLGAVTIVGDSVLAASVYPAGGHRSLSQYLADLGFGPIVARAASGLTAGYAPTGYFGMPADVTVSSWLAEWRADGWDAPNVIVNVGAIDSGFCRTDLTCARNSIQHVIDALGPGHHIWWPQITRFYTHQAEADTWNAALAEFDAARDDFTTWDWPSVLVAESFDVYDGVHLASAAEHARRSERIAREVYGVWATAHRVGGDAALPAATASPARLTPVDPVRVLDTRGTGVVGAGQVAVVALDARVPATATSVIVNVTATQAGADGFLTAYPCGGAVPEASNVNYLAGQDRAASAVVPVGTGRSVCVYTSAASHVVVDLAGYLAPGASLGLVPVDPVRLVDEVVAAGSTRRVPVPGAADAVAVGITADAAETSGYLTVYPCDDDVPEASSVNYGPGEAVAGSAYVGTTGGAICVFTSARARVIVDLQGRFGSGGASFVAAQPTRILDTRNGTGGWAPIHGAGQVLDVAAAPPGAVATTGSLTEVGSVSAGWETAHPCGSAVPNASNVNSQPGRAAASGVTVRVDGDGRLCLWASTVTHTLFDVTGWWITSGGTAALAARTNYDKDDRISVESARGVRHR
ncbi:MAG TPA: SGNH/GDSL hydrolase family protein [Ilumatobacteraceae bacterium]|nr:SGNH/GDSL hydrolase family protein [Ilumatobacteraceae bacterium]